MLRLDLCHLFRIVIIVLVMMLKFVTIIIVAVFSVVIGLLFVDLVELFIESGFCFSSVLRRVDCYQIIQLSMHLD